MDLTDLLIFINPGSVSRVKRWADDGADLWDFTNAVTLQASIDECVTWAEGATPITGADAFAQLSNFQADQATKAAAIKQEKQVTAIKAEAGRRILAIMDKNKQRNLLAHAVETIFEYGADPNGWPTADRQLQQDTMPKWQQIKAIRAASDALEAMEPIPADYKNDIHWP